MTHLKTLFETTIADAIANAPTVELSQIVNVFDGDPITYNEADLPAIILEPMDTALQKENQYYEATWRIKISVVVASKQFYGADSSWIVVIKKYIQNIMEQKDSSSSKFNAYSVCWILDNIQCIVEDNQIISNELYMESIQYQNLAKQWFVGYRADMIVRIFNKQIQRI